MTWVDLSSAFGFGAVLTSAQMQNLRDNITAQANGDSGAPKQQTAGIADGAITAAKAVNPAAADTYIVGAALTDKTTIQLSVYTKVCEFVIGFDGEIRLNFDLYHSGGGSIFGRAYLNGVAEGVAHEQNGAGTTSFSDDITVAVGDLVQIYAYRTTGDACEVQGITISTDVMITGHLIEVQV